MNEESKQSISQQRILKDHVERVHLKYHKVVAKAWADGRFKERLLNDPGKVFEEYGIELPPGVRVNVMENTAESWNFVLPANCAEIADAPLEASETAAACVCTCCCGYTMALDEQLAGM